MKEANERMSAMRESLSEVETKVATELVRGSRMVEVPGAIRVSVVMLECKTEACDTR